MQEIKSILLVVNPISGNINKSELIEEIKTRLPENLMLHWISTTPKGTMILSIYGPC